ncbi:NAD(P)H-dependent oxidoreductase [Pigmentiphaga soli]|uniref:NAD(P)H-dependent oxidoreductase n=1 Tax=Pigmentiphaga soli TaxID=1007095 RepID=A0ABP8H295_9BURK
MGKRIAVIVGHPDPDDNRYGRVLARTYAEAARRAGHEAREIDVGRLDFPLLRTRAEWNAPGALPDSLRAAQQDIGWADHLAIFFPLWMGTVPALLKGFFEQVLRPGFAIAATDDDARYHRLLAGKSARVVVTMGMAAPIYRWYFGAGGVRGLERNILAFCGIAPIRTTMIGMIANRNDSARKRALDRIRRYGTEGR